MARITRAMLDPVVARINRITGSPAEPYREEGDKYVPNVGNFHLHSGYDGYQLMRHVEGGGEDNVLRTGYRKPSDLYDLLQAFITGLEFKEKNHE